MVSDKKKIKREAIAKSCYELFTVSGFHNVTVNEIAKTAGIGKGTVYEYFSNKEDIVLELMECLQTQYDTNLNEILNNKFITKTEFLYTIFDIFIDKDQQHIQKKEILKQFFIATITNPSDAIQHYNKTLKDKYTQIINKKINDTKQANMLYDAILGEYLLSLTLDIDLPSKVKNIILHHTKGV